jgi:hypothetical protein
MSRLPVCTLFAALVLTGCSDDESNPTGGVACADYAGVSGSPSFSADVMPIFQLSCALSTSCHQSPSGKEGLSLGPPLTMMPDQATLDAVHAGLVGASSVRSALPLVAAGDPAGSWLMGKLEYEGAEFQTCDANTQCGDTCGDRMPQGNPRVEQARIDILAAWIASGAPNN